MSADNGIYILITSSSWKREGNAMIQVPSRPVYRVAQAQAIENFDWLEVYQPYNLGAYMVDIWGKSPVYEQKSQAMAASAEMAEGIEVLEYGISFIHRPQYTFYND
jgi:hypothetical protein